MYRPNDLLYLDECERLKDMFLMESSDDGLGDLSEAEPNDSVSEDEKGDGKKDTGKKDNGNDDESGDAESGDTSDDKEDSGSDDADDTGNDDSDIDLSGDTEMDQMNNGLGADPTAASVNQAPQAPGAINPLQLYTELTEGKTDVRDAVVNVLLQEYPNKQCTGKDMLRPIARAVTAFMKHHNYAPLPQKSMEALCFRLAEDIIERTKQSTTARPAQQPGNSTQAPAPAQARPAAQQPMESVWRAVGATKDSCFSLMEMWSEIEGKPLDEGAFGKTAAAMALAGAGLAGAATADSAPYNTLAKTPRYQSMQHAAAAARMPDSTYKLSAKDAAGMTVADTSARNSAKVAPAPGQAAPGTAPAAATQAQVKQQAKTGKTTAEISNPGNKTQTKATADKGKVKKNSSAGSDDRCVIEKPATSKEDVREAIHDALHTGADKLMQGGEGLLTGIKDGALGLYHGFKRGWKNGAKNNEAEHEKHARETKK